MAVKRKAPAEPPAGALKPAKKGSVATRKQRASAGKPNAVFAQSPAAPDQADDLAHSGPHNGTARKTKSQLKAARKALAAARGKAKHARTEQAQPATTDAVGPADQGGDETAKPAKPAKQPVVGRKGQAAAAAAQRSTAGAAPATSNGGVVTAAGQGAGQRRPQGRAASVLQDTVASSEDDEDDVDDEKEAEEEGGSDDAADREQAEWHRSHSAAELDGLASAPRGAEQAAAGETTAGVPASTGGFRNKEKVLILSSRGIPHRCGMRSRNPLRAEHSIVHAPPLPCALRWVAANGLSALLLL